MSGPAIDPPPAATAGDVDPYRASLPKMPPIDLPALVGAHWPEPKPPPNWLVPAATGAGVVGAVVLPFEPRAGVGAFLAVLVCAVPVAVLARGRRGVGAWTLGALAVGLAWMSVVRASEWLVFLCLVAATCLAIAAVLDARNWAGVLRCVVAFPVAVILSVPWLQRSVPRPRRRSGGGDPADRAAAAEVRERRTAWASGIAVGGVAALAVGALLASADAAFAHLLGALVPDLSFDLDVDLGTIPARGVVFVLLVCTVLGGAYGVLSRVTWITLPPAMKGRRGHAAEWLTPVVLVGAVIGLFLGLQATMLFGGADVVLSGTGISHASRAREGFGQLFLVTLIVLGLLSWAARRAERGDAARHRRLFAVAGGTLTVMTLVLAASAMRRLWLYQDQYGWTVTRIVAGSIELWIAFLLVAVAVAWALRRIDVVPRLVIGSAGAALFALSIAGPDHLAARWNVDRFDATGRIDTEYLSRLSADAVPALDELPEPVRSCTLFGREISDDGWTTWNLAREVADRKLRDRPPVPPPLPSPTASTPGPACGDVHVRP